MSIGELTDRAAVLSAIAEYDELGREAFLQKYGFRPSKAFWLVHEGRRYDSKAIAGAAFGFQHPERGALRPSDFSGGETGVQGILEALGFQIEVDVTPGQISKWIRNLRVSTLAGDQPAPHKPLLLLVQLRRLRDGLPRLAPVQDVADEVGDLLRHALPSVAAPSAWEPIWRLEPQLWEVSNRGEDLRVRFAQDDPPMNQLRALGVRCGLAEEVHAVLGATPDWISRIEDEIVEQHLKGIPADVIARARGSGVDAFVNVWWVNQGQTYNQEHNGGFVWAPTKTQAGHPVAHHTAVSHLRPNDVVLHYSKGSIRALGRVSNMPTVGPRPSELPEDLWGDEGHQASVDYFDLNDPIALNEVLDRPRSTGPFDKNGDVNVGYLYPLPPDWASGLRKGFADRWPAGSPWAIRNHWLFQSNPNKWDLAENLETWEIGEIEPWTLNQHKSEVADGDDVLLFSSGADGGALAIGEVVGEPEVGQRPEWRSEGSDEQLNIGVRLRRALRPPILREQLKSHPVLSGLAVFKFAQGTQYKVTDEEWRAFMDLLDQPPTLSDRCLVVYVGRSSEPNLAHSLDDGTWGWRTSQPEYAEVQAGDQILLASGFSGGSPRVQPDQFVEHQFRHLVVGVVTSPVTEESDPYWPDEVDGVIYPHRVQFEFREGLSDVNIADLDAQFGGPVADAFRLSAIGAGKGVVVEVARPKPVTPEELRDVVDTFAEDLRACGYYYGTRHDELVRTFVTSLATKRFVILTGLSGSGKTKIAQNFGKWLGPGRSQIIAVRPDWTNPDPLLGYENGLSRLDPDTGYAWNVPEALSFMLRAIANPTRPHVLLLDEMNLAHVERYFADVLSGMESNHPVIPNLAFRDDGWRIADKDHPRLPFPPNLFIVGTVNVDETTYMFSPKVLDRANTIEFRVHTDDLQLTEPSAPPIGTASDGVVAAFLTAATRPADHTGSGAKVAESMKELHVRLIEHGREFGHRTYAEATRFADLLESAGDSDHLVALDLQVLQKVLPKYHGSVRELSEALKALGAWCLLGPGPALPTTFDAAEPPASAPVLPRSFDKVHRMAKRLKANHFVSFAE